MLPFSLSFAYNGPHNDLVKRGEALMMQRDFQQAIFFFTRAIEEFPDSPHAYLHRARALMISDRYGEAIADYKRAMELDPESTQRFFKEGRLDNNQEKSLNTESEEEN